MPHHHGCDQTQEATTVWTHMQDAKSSSREAGNAGNDRWQSSSRQTNKEMVRRHRRLVRLYTPGSCSHGERPGQVEDNHWPQRPTWVMSSQRECAMWQSALLKPITIPFVWSPVKPSRPLLRRLSPAAWTTVTVVNADSLTGRLPNQYSCKVSWPRVKSVQKAYPDQHFVNNNCLWMTTHNCTQS